LGGGVGCVGADGGIASGYIFRAINKGGRGYGAGSPANVI
jgi:hypothetical protein